MLPPTVPSAVANLAVSLWGKIPVNLNYTASQELVDSSIDQCGITHVVTSSKVLDRFKLRPKGTLIHLEELPAQVTALDKAWAAMVSRLVPIPLLDKFLPGLRGDDRDAIATVIFTSGSTGDPKGVVLSHGNILSNVHQVSNHIELHPEEVLLGILPFFHSFGFTVTIWVALGLGKKVVYHFNPLDARIIGNLCEKHRITLIAATPTYARLYMQKCEVSQFKCLTHLLLGAEKLKPELFRDIQKTLGIEPMEGYGTTELSPVVALNVPHGKALPDGRQVHGNRPGTVGLPIPGTAIKTIDPETGKDLPAGTEGVICVKGPQVMQGYLGRPEATAKVLKDGWYSTGDLGYLDADGFLKITDRLSRFSKIGGEMVPHVGVESAIMGITGVTEENVAVTGIPDVRAGERLRVLYTELRMSPVDVCRGSTRAHCPSFGSPPLVISSRLTQFRSPQPERSICVRSEKSRWTIPTPEPYLGKGEYLGIEGRRVGWKDGGCPSSHGRTSHRSGVPGRSRGLLHSGAIVKSQIRDAPGSYALKRAFPDRESAPALPSCRSWQHKRDKGQRPSR
jgi:acyl-[acyl-carrier-protein]-phospholipid O-acyltransferase/long-chain-fatty-acid--[acyl-carrier-protein] ligase